MGICDCETHQNGVKNDSNNNKTANYDKTNTINNNINQNEINILEKIKTPIPNQLIIPEKSKNNENKENIEDRIINQKIYENFELKNSNEAHYDIITCLIELHNKKIMTGSYDKTVKTWNLDQNFNFQCDRIVKTEEKVMCLLEFESNMILIGTQLETIGLIDINNPKQKMHSFKGHLLYINCLVKCDEQNFASASNDTDIRIWNYYKRECIGVLSGHQNNIFCLIKLKNGKLCSGSADKTIKIWNWNENKCEINITVNRSWIKCLYELNNGNIISGGDDAMISVWENNKEKKELKGHEDSIKALYAIDERYIASASFDKTIKIWDLNTGNNIQTLIGHLDKVICVLYHSDGYLLSCSKDKTLKIWKQGK